MSLVAATVLALTIGLALAQPSIGGFRIRHHFAALGGALITIAVGLVTPAEALDTVRPLGLPLLTIASLMVMTIVAERARLLESIALRLARRAAGDGRRLFVLIFACGTVTGTLFTNDAAVLIFTPLVIALVEDVQDESWTPANKVPFYFAVLYVGNLVGMLVISNPINIIVAGFFGIRFLQYAAWMALPALVSMLVTLAGLWGFFRRDIPSRCRLPELEVTADPRLAPPCVVLVAATLAGFFSKPWTGLPAWLVATIGAVSLLAIAARQGHSPRDVLRGVGWDVLIFVCGIFVVVRGLRNVGLTDAVGDAIAAVSGQALESMSLATAMVAAICSAFMNNHPTAGLMIWVIEGFQRTAFETEILVYSALIGGDLGPKMLPIGSLAALLWFGILRGHGIAIPYWLYIKIGVPVTIAAILMSVLTLHLEIWLVS